VAEPLELFRLKSADHRYTGDMTSTHFKRNNPMVCRVTSVAEPLELFLFKCADHYYTGEMTSTHFKRNNPMVCRVMSRWNHQIPDRSSVPCTKVSLEIQSPLHFYNIVIVVITNWFLVEYCNLTEINSYRHCSKTSSFNEHYSEMAAEKIQQRDYSSQSRHHT
jgi:hypothetical protein